MALAVSRRGFIAGLSAFVGGLVLDEVTGLFVPKRKIWVVGSDLVRDPASIPIYTPRIPLQRSDLLSEYIRGPEGRTKLAASMIMPLRRQLDYQSISRSMFSVQQLPDFPAVSFSFIDQPFRFDHSKSKA